MRLTSNELETIRTSINGVDPEAEIYLFGSRLDDRARGGNIDLLVLSQRIDLMAKLDILARLHQTFGEQRIDLMIEPDLARPFARIAVDSGVRL